MSDEDQKPLALIVEDAPRGAETIADFLEEDRGFKAVSVTGFAQAVKKMDELPSVALVITDFNLPDNRTGIDVINEARSRFSAVPAILLSAKAKEATEALAANHDGNTIAFLAKPVSLPSMRAKLDEANAIHSGSPRPRGESTTSPASYGRY